MSRSPFKIILLPALVCLADVAPAAVPYYYQVWQLGADNTHPDPFGDDWRTNNAPGSAAALDDDYYLAGTYPVGQVATDEPIANLDRSVSSSDQRKRIHFMLSAVQASGTARLKVSVDLIWGSSATPGFATHDISITMNGQPVGTATGVNWNRTLEFTVPALSVNAVAGANVLEIQRTGGTTGGGVCFDYLKLDSDPIGMTDFDGDGLPLWYEEAFGLSDADASDAQADPDGDGRFTLLEKQAGTNPTDPDTDNDGISDSAEIQLGTNPLLRDHDGDGIADGAETTTSPLLADSDSDGHPDNIEIEQGSNPNSAASVPFDFPGAIGLQFVCEALQSATLPAGEPAGFFRLPHWNATPGLSEWEDNGVVLNGSMSALKNHRGQATTAAASWSYHYADEGLHKGPSDERLFNGMIRVEKSTAVPPPATVSLTGIPYPTYDLLVYVGNTYPGNIGVVKRGSDSADDRYFVSASMPPFRGFTEVTSNSQAAPRPGNYVRYRDLSGASQTITLQPVVNDIVGIHGIQIVNSGADTDGDGLKDVVEIEHRLNPAIPDAQADADGDDVVNATEIANRTDVHHPDSDRDGWRDNLDTSPLDPDFDDDGLLDGDEIYGSPFTSLTNDTDSDNDGTSDAVERAAGSNPMSAASVPPPVPVWDAATRTWRWRIDNIRLLWNHSESMVGALSGSETMLCEAVTQINGGGWNKQVGIGLRSVAGRVTYRFRCIEGLFNVNGNGHWSSDWGNPPADRTKDFGLSGFGEADDSKPLRMEFTATRPDPTKNLWNITFLIADLTNPGSPVTLASSTWNNAVAADTSLLDGSAVWANEAGQAGAFDVLLETGVDAFITPDALGPADADSDGMPDTWENTHAFNPVSATDAASDADSDGLTNLKEFLSGTSPRDPDSDDDGANDGIELHHGSNPLLNTSKPAWFNFTGNLADLDGDGLSDAWTLWSGGIPRLPLADDDGDGMSNLAECEAGTDPDDPTSKIDLTAARESGNLVLSWPDTPLKDHYIQTSATLDGWPLASGLPGSSVTQGRRRLVIPSNSLPAGNNFYRTGIVPKDSDGDGVEDWTEANVTGTTNGSTNSAGQSLVRANGQTLSGDAAALLEKIQGSSSTGGTPGSSSPGTPSPVNASRFLMQSTFGPIPEDIAKVRQLGYDGWIEEQLALPPSFHTPYIQQAKADAAGAHIDPTYNYSTQDNFLFGNNATTPFARNAIGAPDQLRQRVAFALSQILVVSRRDANLEEKPEAITNYYDMLVRHSFGNYGDLLLDTALHPAMGIYLSHAGNQKADPTIPRYPDENFAREIMQLFSIGLWELNPDGSRKLDVHGEPIPTYDNGDITELARVFTGLYFASPYGWGGGGWADDHYTRPMVMYPDRHDFESKKLPNGFVVPPRDATESNGMQDVRDAVDALFRHPNTPPFVCRQLIQFLVTDNPTPSYIQRVQDVFVNDGSGTRGNLGAVVKAILLDPEARQQPLSDSFGKAREPVIRTMHLGRLFKLAETHPDFVWWNWTETYYGSSKQEPMNSPSVFNFYTPVYQAPGEIRNGGHVSPGFQIIDTFSSISFPNLIWEYLHYGFRSSYDWYYPLDFSSTLLLAENPAALVDHVNLLVCAGNMTTRTRGILLTAISNSALSQKERVALAVWTAMTSPEGAIQR